MINIQRKEDCVGCNSCVQKCPKQCISMLQDEQGFLYPKVDLDKCINCHLCENVCPVLNQADPRNPIQTYAAKNKNEEVQRTSSSGGVFSALATKIINEGGVVFGVRFDQNWEVIHNYAETIEQVKAFQGSKYVQSRIGDMFEQAEALLKTGRKVLFSGTPCQIAGLRLFLRKDYGDQLLLVDIACHGVPSPLIWRDYLCKISTNNGYGIDNIKDLSFRDKRNGWQDYGIRICFARMEIKKEFYVPMKDNIYMQGFLKDLYLRPSCYECPTKCGKSNSDITLADFWGIDKTYPQLYDSGYYSLVLARSNNGLKALESISIKKEEIEYSKALAWNPALEQSAHKPKESNIFWKRYAKEGIPTILFIIDNMKPSFPLRICSYVRLKGGRVLRAIGLKQ